MKIALEIGRAYLERGLSTFVPDIERLLLSEIQQRLFGPLCGRACIPIAVALMLQALEKDCLRLRSFRVKGTKVAHL